MKKAIDAGNYETKFYDGLKLRKFPSAIGTDYRSRKLEQRHGDYDFEWEYDGKRGFAGTLAQESESGGSIGGDTKAHFDAKLRVLIALHQFSTDEQHDIVVGQPISRHENAEKTAIKQMLIGTHVLTVNGERKVIRIRRCEVAAEGVVAGLLTPSKGIVRVIDIGSATVNYGTLKDMRFLDLGSWTELRGMNTFTHADYQSIGRIIAIRALQKWSKDDRVLVCGGGAEFVFPSLQLLLPHAELVPDATYANVKAFYAIAGRLYG